jgi:predicted nucleic acid-binding protein
MRYIVQGCVERTDYNKLKRKITIETVIEIVRNDEADFFGVYEVQKDGTEQWIADFMDFDDAVMFASAKEKEEAK